MLNMIILPRQARDKHRESTQKEGVSCRPLPAARRLELSAAGWRHAALQPLAWRRAGSLCQRVRQRHTARLRRLLHRLSRTLHGGQRFWLRAALQLERCGCESGDGWKGQKKTTPFLRHYILKLIWFYQGRLRKNTVKVEKRVAPLFLQPAKVKVMAELQEAVGDAKLIVAKDSYQVTKLPLFPRLFMYNV
jgi:hypothetical protein